MFNICQVRFDLGLENNTIKMGVLSFYIGESIRKHILSSEDHKSKV